MCAGRLNENSNVHVQCLSFVFRCDEVDSNRLRPHLLRTSDYCWCDKDAINHFAQVQDLTFHRCMALYVRSMYCDHLAELVEFTVYHCKTDTITSITIHLYTQNGVLNYFSFQGFVASLYVVEITVFPWRYHQLKTDKGQLHLDLHPVYEDEEGKCYFRRQASLVQVLHLYFSIGFMRSYFLSFKLNTSSTYMYVIQQ